MTDHRDVPSDALADSMHLQPSPFLGGLQAAVAVKGGINVCWNCHKPVVSEGSFVDVPMGETFVRLCHADACAEAVIEEKSMSMDGATIVSV
jgi:hypothetical protein